MSKEKINLSILINSSRERVWKVLLDDKTYREWVSVFMEGSYAKTDWKEGSKALFLGPDETGMVSRIEKHIPNEVLTIEHLGIVKNGGEDFESEEAREWNGTHETYRLSSENGKTELSIEQDVTAKYREYFEKTWKQALAKVKELAEKG